jgi:hypothetical protein
MVYSKLYDLPGYTANLVLKKKTLSYPVLVYSRELKQTFYLTRLKDNLDILPGFTTYWNLISCPG